MKRMIHLPTRHSVHLLVAGLAASGVLAAGSVSCASSSGAGGEAVQEGSSAAAGHGGPTVQSGATGTARFAAPIYGGFDRRAAMSLSRTLDDLHRAPASEGYDEGIDHINEALSKAGYGEDDGFEIETLSAPMARPAWTPISAELRVVVENEEGRDEKETILGFSEQDSRERVMLPIDAPSFNIAGAPVFTIESITPGSIFVTDASVRAVEQEAVAKGAAGVVSDYLLKYTVDPSGAERHYDAIFSGRVRAGSTLPSLYVSPRIADAIREAADDGATLEMSAQARLEVKGLRTATATIRGAARPDEIVYVVAHADGAGGNDNASGAAAIVEVACSMHRLITSGEIERPMRSIRFVFGREARAGDTVLENMDGTPVACVVADMIGTSYEKTGARCLLERGWDPGAVVALPPDEHTPWGAGSVVEEDIVPNGLTAVLRQALVDVAGVALDEDDAAWVTREHPWEGGSDHDTYLARGIAAALFWHFTDFSYSTSLDRIDHVDPAELHRTAATIGTAACAVADLREVDLARYLDTLMLERQVRLDAASDADEDSEALQEMWRVWFDGAEGWLAALAAGESLPESDGLPSLGE